MRNTKTVVIILLNILFCAITLWLFTRNSYLRPYAGSSLKEILAGVLVLGSLYVNYFLLYPKLYLQYPHIIYWLAVALIAIVTALVDMAIAYPYIVSHNAEVIQLVGSFDYFSKILFFTVERNLALNLFPYLLRERQHYQQALEKEVKVVYHYVRKLDVTDKDNNIHLVDIDKIFYCHQQGNFTEVHTVQNKKYTRLGSMKHLEQLFGEEDFIRITSTVLIPFRYTKSCKDNMVIMKKMPWEEEPTTFQLETKSQEKIAKKVIEGLLGYRAVASGKKIQGKTVRPKVKRKPITPSDEKIKEVLSFIEKHSNCNTGYIIAETGFSSSTVERCLFELRKQGLIKHNGSKKKGGYEVVNIPLVTEDVEHFQQEEIITPSSSRRS